MVGEEEWEEEGLFVFQVVGTASVVVKSQPTFSKVDDTRLEFDVDELVSADLILHFGDGEGGNNGFCRLTDHSGWLCIRNVQGEEQLRPIPVTRGWWTWYVDSVPQGVFLRRHPVQSMDLRAQEVNSGIDDYIWLAPLQSFTSHARVQHPGTGVLYYRLQTPHYSGWIYDKEAEYRPVKLATSTSAASVIEFDAHGGEVNLDDEDVVEAPPDKLSHKQILLPREKVQKGLFCFRALQDISIRNSPTIYEAASNYERVNQGQLIAVDVIRRDHDESGPLSPNGYNLKGLNGPYLRLADGSGWLFIHKRGQQIMEEVPVERGFWNLQVANYPVGMALRRHPMDTQTRFFAKKIVYPPNSLVQCYARVQGVGITYYQVLHRDEEGIIWPGWIFDRRVIMERDPKTNLLRTNVVAMAHVLAASPTNTTTLSSDGSSKPQPPLPTSKTTSEGWSPDLIRGMALCVQSHCEEEPTAKGDVPHLPYLVFEKELCRVAAFYQARSVLVMPILPDNTLIPLMTEATDFQDAATAAMAAAAMAIQQSLLADQAVVVFRDVTTDDLFKLLNDPDMTPERAEKIRQEQDREKGISDQRNDDVDFSIGRELVLRTEEQKPTASTALAVVPETETASIAGTIRRALDSATGTPKNIQEMLNEDVSNRSRRKVAGDDSSRSSRRKARGDDASVSSRTSRRGAANGDDSSSRSSRRRPPKPEEDLEKKSDDVLPINSIVNSLLQREGGGQQGRSGELAPLTIDLSLLKKETIDFFREKEKQQKEGLPPLTSLKFSGALKSFTDGPTAVEEKKEESEDAVVSSALADTDAAEVGPLAYDKLMLTAGSLPVIEPSEQIAILESTSSKEIKLRKALISCQAAILELRQKERSILEKLHEIDREQIYDAHRVLQQGALNSRRTEVSFTKRVSSGASVATAPPMSAAPADWDGRRSERVQRVMTSLAETAGAGPSDTQSECPRASPISHSAPRFMRGEWSRSSPDIDSRQDEHGRTHHGLACPVCRQVFKSNEKLLRHQKLENHWSWHTKRSSHKGI